MTQAQACLDGGAAREGVQDVPLLVEGQVHDRIGNVEQRRPQELVRALALAAAVALLAALVALPPAVGVAVLQLIQEPIGSRHEDATGSGADHADEVDAVGRHGEARLVDVDLRGLAAGRPAAVDGEHHHLERGREQQQPLRHGAAGEDARPRLHQRRVDDGLVEAVVLVEGAARVGVVPQEEHVVDGHPRAVDLREEAHEHMVLELLARRLLEREGHLREASGDQLELWPLVHAQRRRLALAVQAAIGAARACLLEQTVVEVAVSHLGVALRRLAHELARLLELLPLRGRQFGHRSRTEVIRPARRRPCAAQGLRASVLSGGGHGVENLT